MQPRTDVVLPHQELPASGEVRRQVTSDHHSTVSHSAVGDMGCKRGSPDPDLMVTGGDISAAYKELAKRSRKRRDMVCAEGAQRGHKPAGWYGERGRSREREGGG